MRTRATGQSPGGFHVLPSPKRVRRQPPPLRASRPPATAPEFSEEEATETGNELVSFCSHESFLIIRDASNAKLVLRSNNTQKRPVSNGQKTLSSTKSRSTSANNVVARSTKNTVAKKRAASVKKTQTSRSLNNKKANLKASNSRSKDGVEVQAIQQSRQPSSNPQPIQSILGKRDRSASLNFPDNVTVNNTIFNPKRARILNRNSSQIDQAPDDTYQKITPNRSERKLADTSQNDASGLRNSQQDLSKLSRLDQEATPNSVKKIALPLKTNSTPPSIPSRKITTSKVNPDNTEHLETHLRRGMQSIMSRMNKYQYQPLPKSSQDSTIVEILSNEDQNDYLDPLNHPIVQSESNACEKYQDRQDFQKKDPKNLDNGLTEKISEEPSTSDGKLPLLDQPKNASVVEKVICYNFALDVPN